MSRKTRMVLVVVVAALAFAVLATPAIAASRTYTAHLFGANEVPAVDTKATGQAVFKLNADGTALDYRLIVSKLENVTAAHIHLGAAGVNGPVVAFLTTAHPGTSHGVIAVGTITVANLVGPLAGQPFADLIAAIEAGNTYVNVHTAVNPTGVIRGQIR